jgi:aspartokinase
MQMDRNQLEKLLSMDNGDFQNLARIIADAAGADKNKAELLIQNPELLKKRLASVSPEEAQKLISAAGEEKSKEIMDMLNKRGVDFGQ